jgi:hypothetical protein
MNVGRIAVMVVGLLQFYLSPGAMADTTVDAVKLSYQEFEEGIEPYRVSYTVSGEFVRIDDESDSSGHIVYDIGKNTIYSISHYDESILVVPEYKTGEFKPDFEVAIDYRALEDAPGIAGKNVYTYEVKAVTGLTSETCMAVQLVPGLLPDVAKTLQKFQKLVSGQQAATLEKTPEEFRTPCYLVDQVYNQGEYYSKGLPIQEWHSNERQRQLLNFEDVKVDVSIFDIPAEYRQYSLMESTD